MNGAKPARGLRLWMVTGFVGLCAVGASLPVFAPSSAQGSQAVINGVVLAIAAAAVIGVWRMPAGSTLWWFVPVVLVPASSAVELWGVRVAPVALFASAILAGLAGPRWRKWTAIDVAAVALGAALLASGLFGTPHFLIAQGLGEWLLCAAAGRALITAGRFRGDHVAKMGAVLGALAAIQVLTRFNASHLLPTSESGAAWAGLQYRDGLVRAELTFGHSISLGAVLAICLAFALRLSSRRRAIVLSSMIGVGILATQSRGALLAAAIVVALTVWASERTDRPAARRVLRFAIPAGLLALPAFVYYFLLGGRDPYSEVAQGSEYRLGILSTAHDANLLGLARNGLEFAPGRFNWDGAVSIDNTILYLALYAGWLVAIAYVAPLALVAWRARRRGWTTTAIALFGQIPLLLTVAPITQYQSVLWLILGVAAGSATVGANGHASPLQAESESDDPLTGAAMTDVACVVVHHHHFPQVLDTIEDIRRSGVPDEHIVVVDNSTDPEVSAALANAIERVMVIEVPNRGYGAAVNSGLDELDRRGINTRFVLISTHEVRLDRSAVRVLRNALMETPGAAVVGPTLVSPDGADIWSVGGELSLFLTIPRHARHTQPADDAVRPRHPVRREWLDGALCLYDRSVLTEQRFREDFFLYFEEAELHSRMRSAGRTVLWVPEARASQSTSGVPAWLLGRNLQLFVGLHGTVLGRWAATPWMLARRAAGAILRRQDLDDVRTSMRGWHAARRQGFDAPWIETHSAGPR